MKRMTSADVSGSSSQKSERLYKEVLALRSWHSWQMSVDLGWPLPQPRPTSVTTDFDSRLNEYRLAFRSAVTTTVSIFSYRNAFEDQKVEETQAL